MVRNLDTKLFPMVQRYKFESKSQLEKRVVLGLYVVSNGSKVQIWKQITTDAPQGSTAIMLFPMVQRYKFESKSQRRCLNPKKVLSCFQWFKGTNLKANHNSRPKISIHYLVVSNGSKVQIWKQITTTNDLISYIHRLFPMVQRYKFESKSQHEKMLQKQMDVVSNGSKVQIWKQITTGDISTSPRNSLFPMVQRYKFESKSQQVRGRKPALLCCFQWFKGTNLKANHNLKTRLEKSLKVVSNGSKVQIWKQITTAFSMVFSTQLLFPMVQRYKFESKSQLSPSARTLFNSLFPMVQRYKFESKSQRTQGCLR